MMLRVVVHRAVIHIAHGTIAREMFGLSRLEQD